MANDYVLKNEFFSYTAQKGEDRMKLGALATKHKAALIDHVQREARVTVFQVP